jgi:tetratricopeptide (TPR) repeat protein
MSSDVGTPFAGEQLGAATGPPACPACGRTAQPDASFCPFCGTGLVHQRVPGYPVFAAVAAAITGRTAYDVLNRVGGLFEGHGAVFEGVSEAPGTLVSLFPPTEDAATIAAQAALEAQAAAPEVRLGLDAAEVTERSDQDAIWQFLIDGAVRLQAMAQDGEVVAGEAVLPLTEGAAVVSPIDPAGGPVLVGAIRDLTPRVAPMIAADPHPTEAVPADAEDDAPFVGRTEELAEIRARFAGVLDGDRAACVAVVGEPGIGKTRLLRTSAEELSDVASVWIPTTRDGGAWPVAALITAIVGVAQDGDGIGDALELIAGAEPDGERIVKRLAYALGLPGGEPAADETRWAVRRLLECVSSEPLVIWADDVDRVAPGFAAFLAEVVAAVRDRSILVVCTAVSAPPGIAQILYLEPLEGGTPSGGGPGVDAGFDPEPASAIVLDDDHVPDADPTEEPDILTRSAARAEALGDPAGAAGFERRAAASLPKDDPLRAELLFRAALHEVEAGRPREAESAITEAVAAGSSGGAIEWQLRVLRASLRVGADPEALDAARAVADEAYDRFLELEDDWGLARALELRAAVHGARGHAAAVAEDLIEAAVHARAAGRPTEHANALRGAAAALLNGPVAVHDAIAACDRLREEAAGSRTLEQDLNGTLAVLLARSGRIDEARTVVAEAVASMEELGARTDLAVASHRQAIVGWLAGDADTASAALRRAYAAAVDAGDERLRAAIAATWATLLVTPLGRVAGASEATEALELADVARTWGAEPATNVGWRVARARALMLQGRTEEADRLARDAVSVAEQTDSVDLRANALLHLAWVLAGAGRPDEAAAFERRAHRLIERAGTSVVAAVRAPNEATPGGPADLPDAG